MLIEVCIGLGALLLYLYYRLSKNKDHWSQKGVPNTGFRFFWGNDKDFLMKTRAMHDVAKEEYFQFPGESFYGGWTMLGQPYLMIRNDFDLIRAIWIKDFDHFNQTRGADFADKIWPASRAERMAINHVGNVHGEVWKDLRSTFTPIFSSGKLKNMLPLLQEINNKIEDHIKEQSQSNEEIELKDLMGKFSMDALASCAFGVDSGSFANGSLDSEFVKQAKIIFGFGNMAILQMLMSLFTPTPVKKFFAALGFKNFAAVPNIDANEFFQNVIEASIKQRKQSKSRRNDLVDLMIDATEGKLNPEEEEDGEKDDRNDNDQKDKKTKDVDYEQVIATAGILLIAGYDTTATTMSYVLYELAVNPGCQDTLFEEIENAKNDHNGLSYDTIQALPYLDSVVHETLRRHPIVAALERPCVKEYKIPNTDLVLKKGDLVRMNAIGILNDPDIYPNPDEWNPENFSKENRATRNPYSFMAFSLGPRNCLAMRFALFEMKAAISHMVLQFKLLPTNKTVRKVQRDPNSIFGGAKGGLWIKFEER